MYCSFASIGHARYYVVYCLVKFIIIIIIIVIIHFPYCTQFDGSQNHMSLTDIALLILCAARNYYYSYYYY